ncbi:DNA polymerase III subunit epsilon [Mesorhizobium sp. AR10]|uniref:3'-5' exonuclease n=1 Tax=Mesorhizobium sp. AR10 TaxID=2865839 RepID=UPI0021604BB0|nr:exonuclease domain-containing protein [Mesorhizobium sp. AR10]UVK38753.1 DNA polymerase III subunit epsilon [Mesorhizobium sp. AR10]
MKVDRHLVLAMLAPGAALAVWLALGCILLLATLDPAQRAAVDVALGPLVPSHGMLPVLWWLIASTLAAWVAHGLHKAHVATPARLADATRVLIGDAEAPDLIPQGGAAIRDLTGAINALSGQRRGLQEDMARLVAEASRDVAKQRDQLAALMAELNQSVVVCNLDGRILLYNGRARLLFRRLSLAPQGAGGAELIGLGRSIYSVIDRLLIAHALETVERRIARGSDAATASARFVTGTPAGHLLRVSMAPVRPAAANGLELTGFVLLLDDITDEYLAHSQRDRELLELTEASRASFASMQAALDMLDYRDLDAEERDRFHKVVRDEVSAMSTRLNALAASTSQDLITRWPLQEMLGVDLLAAAARRIEAGTGQPVTSDEIDGTLWLSVDSFALIQALAFLAGRLVAAFDRPELRLRLTRAGGRAHVDIIWSGQDARSEILLGWQTGAMEIGDERSPLSVRDVVDRHGGEVWFERDRVRGLCFFRFLLPLATGEPVNSPREGSRPEYYDFDLFAASEGSRALDDRLLGEIAYTVFDTETTGLDPVQGDEILQIGATRIVNGKLLHGECLVQLVDPQRSIPEASIPVHGIRPEMVRGQPTIAEALPAFHAFASDTVLVGHNVAFDMRFIKLKEAVSGVRFDQPVLDTLLLSSVVHPNEVLHSLEAIAARLGVSVSGRHTALGDALATAEVFLKLLPLLRQKNIFTLGQAREAAQESYYARLRY